MTCSADVCSGFDTGIVRVLRDDGTLDPSTDPHLEDSEVRLLFRAMLLTRTLDDRLTALQRQGRIGFHIGCRGEEAAIIGAAYPLRPGDFIFPCYREFGAALLRGVPLQRYVDNMFGNALDPSKGRQMPDHLTWRKAGFGSVSAPIGTQIPHAVGFAWAAKLQHRDVVSLCYFGEGATSSPEFHNGMNFAGVFHVPTVLVCRNNGWAISLPAERQTASSSFAIKGNAYGVRSVRCDGNDLFAVVACTAEAVRSASSGQGPTLIEAMTYRMAGHSTSDDPTAYRADEQVDAWRRRDPIDRVRRYLLRRGAMNESEEDKLVKELNQEIQEAIESGEKAPPPALESLFDDVYLDLPWHLREQRESLVRGPRPQTG